MVALAHVSSMASNLNANAESRSRSRNRSGASDSSPSDGTHSADGVHFEWTPGQVLNSTYTLVKLLGDGTFGRVLLADSKQLGRQVAVKVIRDVERYTEAAMIEAEILTAIYAADSQWCSRCAIMYEAFMHGKTNFCLVFEPLGIALYDVLKQNSFRGFWLQDIQVFSRDLLHALSFLHGQLRIAHTDLKPENILLESMEPLRPDRFHREEEWKRSASPSELSRSGPYMRPASSRIKLIDFGNATREHEHHSTIISTRQYRSPEVLLATGWNEQSDIWSAGCILMELYTGELLFQSNGDFEQLALMVHIIGPFPQPLIDAASESVKKSYMLQDEASGRWRFSWPERPLPGHWERQVGNRLPLVSHVLPKHKVFADLLASMLELQPCKRLRAINAVLHPFLKAQFED